MEDKNFICLKCGLEKSVFGPNKCHHLICCEGCVYDEEYENIKECPTCNKEMDHFIKKTKICLNKSDCNDIIKGVLNNEEFIKELKFIMGDILDQHTKIATYAFLALSCCMLLFLFLK